MIERRKDNLLRLPEVTRRTCLSRTTIYRRIAEGAFPAAVQISPSMVAWYESEIDDWVADPMGWRAAA